MTTRYGVTESALLRHETWKKGFNRLLIILMMMMVITVLSVMMTFWAVTSKPEPRYFAAREDGGILPIVAVREPYLSDNQVTNFATEAITRAMTFNYTNWRQDLTDAGTYFTKNGWESYKGSLNDDGIMDYVVNRKLNMTTTASRAVITRSGLNENGAFSWTVQVPIKITYENSTSVITEEKTADVVVVRVPTWEMSRGVGIETIVIR